MSSDSGDIGNNILTVACVQMNSTHQVGENIDAATGLIREAVRQGADFIALPENAFLMATGEDFQQQIYPEASHPAIAAMRALARETKCWLQLGSVMCREAGEEKCANRSILIDSEGNIAATYDKIHLFDVELPSGEKHYESHRIRYGTQAVVANTPWGGVGLSVCYDLRFPHLYRDLAKNGAALLTVPAAFTRFTGEKGGWHVLNRARAMENGCFVLAPAQCGTHRGANGRQTYGHSLIIDPWGTILAEAGEEPGVILAKIDMAQVAETRRIMPSLDHDRPYRIGA